jgi:hypothetical protein
LLRNFEDFFFATKKEEKQEKMAFYQKLRNHCWWIYLKCFTNQHRSAFDGCEDNLCPVRSRFAPLASRPGNFARMKKLRNNLKIWNFQLYPLICDIYRLAFLKFNPDCLLLKILDCNPHFLCYFSVKFTRKGEKFCSTYKFILSLEVT